jgi:hypothetical protein
MGPSASGARRIEAAWTAQRLKRAGRMVSAVDKSVIQVSHAWQLLTVAPFDPGSAVRAVGIARQEHQGALTFTRVCTRQVADGKATAG